MVSRSENSILCVAEESGNTVRRSSARDPGKATMTLYMSPYLQGSGEYGNKARTEIMKIEKGG